MTGWKTELCKIIERRVQLSVTLCFSTFLLGQAAFLGLRTVIKPVGPSVKHGQRSHEYNRQVTAAMLGHWLFLLNVSVFDLCWRTPHKMLHKIYSCSWTDYFKVIETDPHPSFLNLILYITVSYVKFVINPLQKGLIFCQIHLHQHVLDIKLLQSMQAK